MATTEADVLDRVRAVCVAAGYTEAPGLDFARVPAQAADKSFALRYAALPPVGGMNFTEEARGTVLVSLLRVVSAGHEVAQRAVLIDGRAVLNALVIDGAVTSGEYVVEDAGRSLTIETPRGANHVIGQLRVPVNFEADLSAGS